MIHVHMVDKYVLIDRRVEAISCLILVELLQFSFLFEMAASSCPQSLAKESSCACLKLSHTYLNKHPLCISNFIILFQNYSLQKSQKIKFPYKFSSFRNILRYWLAQEKQRKLHDKRGRTPKEHIWDMGILAKSIS